MKFVAASYNLRVYNFFEEKPVFKHLSYLHYRKIKEDAGNIVHAISSTNAIAAGTQTTESIKVIQKNFN